MADLLAAALAKPVALLPDAISGPPGEPVTFDASASFHPDGMLVSYEWDFDFDGAVDLTTDGPLVEHAYLSDYHGPAAVRVVDQNGVWAVATTEVLISPDGDQVDGGEDNCPATYNPDQEDHNGDGLGDACDPAGYDGTDQNGVTVGYWEEPDSDGDSTIDTVSTWHVPHFNVPGSLAKSTDQDWLGVTIERTGDYQFQLAGLQSDLDLYLADARGTFLDGSGNTGAKGEQIRRTLPAGRYYLLVQAKDGQQSRFDYRVVATPLQR